MRAPRSSARYRQLWRATKLRRCCLERFRQFIECPATRHLAVLEVEVLDVGDAECVLHVVVARHPRPARELEAAPDGSSITVVDRSLRQARQGTDLDVEQAGEV